MLRTRRGRWLIAVGVVLVVLGGAYWGMARYLRQQVLQYGSDGEAIGSVLESFAHELKDQDCDLMLPLLSPDFQTPQAFGWTRVEGKPLDAVTAFRLAPLTSAAPSREAQVAAVKAYRADFTSVDHAKIKILEFTAHGFDPDYKEATCRFWIHGVHKSLGRVEDRGVLRMAFRRDGAKWKISAMQLDHGESVATQAAAAFVDAAAERGLTLPVRYSDIIQGFGELNSGLQMDLSLTLGPVASGDLDNDGWTDVLVTTPQESRVALFHNDHGHFVDITEQAGIQPALTRGTRAILLFDYDNDGYLDIFVGRGAEGNRLLHNNGDGTFLDATAGSGLEHSGPFTFMATAGDYDRDGKLDLFVVNYYRPDKIFDDVFWSENSGNSQLYRNLGNGHFEDVTHAAHAEQNGHSLACTFYDANDDGWPDIFVANDFGINHLFINQKDGTFKDEGREAGFTDIGNFMSVDVADARARGVLDVYATKIDSNSRWYWRESLNMQITANLLSPSYAWQAWMRRRKLQTLADEGGTTLRDLATQKMGGNSFYEQVSPGRYRRVDNGSADAQWAWAGLFIDYDNSGYPSIYSSNGWFSGKKNDDF